MSVRIYALAKELEIDSKKLVDICTRAGVPDKGSALASLDDEEVAKVKEFISGGGKPSGNGKGPAAAPAPQRPAQPKPEGRMKVVSAPKAGKPAVGGRKKPADAPPKPQEPVKAPTADTETPAEPQQEAAESTASEAAESTASEAAPTETPDRPGPLAGMVRKEDYLGPGKGAGGKIPVVGAGGRSGEEKSRKNEPQPKAKPVVRLGAMPAAQKPKQPAAKKKKEDDAPTLKPDMKLPTDVMGGGKLGAKPLAAHLRRAERTLEAEKIREKQAEDDGRKKGRAGAGAGEGKPMLGGREQRQAARNRSGRSAPRLRRATRRRRTGVNTAAPRKGRVEVQLPCTIRDLSESAGVQARDIQRILIEEGLSPFDVQINTSMDPDLTELVAAELGLDVDFVAPATLADKVLGALEDIEDPADKLVERAPVVTFLGHVDHGKTSLIDRLIGIDVAGGESGGITQHIRAYQIDKDGKPIAFVDTPGHEAFTAMRARGANVTDIAVLVVAADDGVMPQTEEAISHAKAAEVPIVVALNKMDLPGADANKAMADLAANELQPSEWGGDIEVVPCSAITGEGMDNLLDTILTVAELHEYKANPDRAAIGTCLEARQDADVGVVAKLVVQTGTLKVGDTVVCGDAYGKVRAMVDPLDPAVVIEEAGPSTPVDMLGFDQAPAGGQRFYVLDDISKAREIAESVGQQERAEQLMGTGFQHVTLDTLYDRLEGVDEPENLNLIVRADVRGSIEAIRKELEKLDHPEVRLRILQATVGGVSEADVHLANASDAIIVAFNVVPDDRAKSLAEQVGVEIRRYSIIYKIADELKAALEGMLKPEERETELGRALVQATFKISRLGVIAGCRVLAGTVERGARCRVIRDNTIVGDYAIDTLRREKDDAKEVREGYECGIKLAGFNDIKEADLLEVYKVEQISRSFED